MRFEKVSTEVSGLLISWAIPAASLPTEASFSASTSWACFSRSFSIVCSRDQRAFLSFSSIRLNDTSREDSSSCPLTSICSEKSPWAIFLVIFSSVRIGVAMLVASLMLMMMPRTTTRTRATTSRLVDIRIVVAISVRSCLERFCVKDWISRAVIRTLSTASFSAS